MTKFCPIIKRNCVEHKCEFFVHVLGKNPQTGDPIDRFQCSFSLLPMLLIENAQVGRGTAAAVESVRNIFVNALPQQAQMRIAAKDQQKKIAGHGSKKGL